MCNTVKLKKIKKSCGEANAPNLKTTIYVTFKEEVTSLPALKADLLEYDGNVVFRQSAAASGQTPAIPAGGWVPLEISALDSSAVDEAQGDKENRYYTSTIKCFINKATAEKSSILNAMNGAELLVMYKDGNGNNVIVGDLDNGATLKYKRQTSPKNGYELEFMVENQPTEAPYYSGNIVVRS